MIASGILSFCLAAVPQDSTPAELRAALTALDAGRVEQALVLAERYVRHAPRDGQGYLVLGDVHAARLPAGRFRALDAYRTAKQLSPGRPEPLERLARVGFQLGGADGERLARENLEGLLDLNAAHATAWDQWLILFRGDGGRNRMIQRLARVAGPTAARRRASLLIEAEAYAAANATLDSLLATDSSDAGLLALRAQSALESGEVATGMALYRRALNSVERDSSDVLWRQVIGIATPAELRAWSAGIRPGQKRRWFEEFWARRHPNLFAGTNERVPEHFARLRHARRHYPLLHPLVGFHRSALARTLTAEPSRGEREFHLRCEVYQDLAPSSGGSVPEAGVISAQDRARFSPGVLAHLTDEEREAAERTARLGGAGARLSATVQRAMAEDGPFAFAPTLFVPLGFGLHDVDSVAARVGYNLATGLDDRGVMYLRFGPPTDVRFGGENGADPQCSSSELERWRYADLGEVRFARPSAFSRGLAAAPEMVFRPMNERQFELMRLGLTADAPSQPATLSFGVWTAQFRDLDDHTVSRVLVVSSAGELASLLVGQLGDASPPGALGLRILRARPGRYALLAHGRSDTELGRQHLALSVRSFAASPALSDLLLLRTSGSPPRELAEALPAIVRTLSFDRSDTVRAYAELYGGRSESGRARYRASYSLLRTNDPRRDAASSRWPDAVRFEFERDVPGTTGAVVAEVLDIQPGRLSAGRYLLRLDVTAPDGSPIGRATTSFEIR